MRVALAWHNVWFARRRLVAAVVAISFSILMIFVQVGSIDAIRRAATLVYDALEFDIILVSNEYQYFNRTGRIRNAQLAQVRVAPGVAEVYPVDSTKARWTPAKFPVLTYVMLLGIPLEPSLVRDEAIRSGLSKLHTRGKVLIDDLSTVAVGPKEIGGEANVEFVKRVQIAGKFRLGLRFYGQGSVVTSPETFRHIGHYEEGWTTFGLVRLHPGTDPGPVLERLKQVLPPDVVAFGRDEFLLMEKDHYTIEMPLGVVVQLGVLMSLILGGVVIAQVLYSDFSNRLREYATLKATGFSTRYILRVGFQQAAILTVLAYIPAWLLAFQVFRVARELSSLPLILSPTISALVFVLALVMSLAAAASALRVVQRADPAELM
jgi:putative ABC transport system permease protein